VARESPHTQRCSGSPRGGSDATRSLIPTDRGTIARAMRIRRAEPSDALTIGQIRIRGWRWAYRGLLPEVLLRGMSDEGREPQRRDRLRHPPPRTGAWVVEEDGCVVGFVFTGPT